ASVWSCRRHCGRRDSPWRPAIHTSKSRAVRASTESRRPDGRSRVMALLCSLRAPRDIAAHLRILQHIVRIAVSENPPLVKRHHTVGVTADDLHVVFDKEHGGG